MSKKTNPQPVNHAAPSSDEHRECEYCGTIYPTAYYDRCPGCNRKSHKDRIFANNPFSK